MLRAARGTSPTNDFTHTATKTLIEEIQTLPSKKRKENGREQVLVPSVRAAHPAFQTTHLSEQQEEANPEEVNSRRPKFDSESM